MRHSDTNPDSFTFACVPRAMSEQFDQPGVKMVHGCTTISGLESDPIIGSALVSAYSTLGLINDARSIFDRIVEPDLVSWNSMVTGYGRGGFWQQGLGLLSRIRNSGKMADGYPMVGLISCFGSPDFLETGQAMPGLCMKTGFDSSAHAGSALVNIYARFGCLNSARKNFNSLRERDLVSWTTLITGLSNSGECQEAVLLF
ncbi:hypothetical protein ACLOJK_037379 [Asimina triloba]